MQENLKYKLVGLAGLLVLLAIGLPIFFDGAGFKERQLTSAIPTAPVMPEVKPSVKQQYKDSKLKNTQAKAKQKPYKVKRSKQQQEKITAKSAPLNIKKDKPKLDKNKLPITWALQLVTLKNTANAAKLVKALKAKGYKAYSRKSGDKTRVYVGPDLQRSELEKLKSELLKEFKLNGMLVRYNTK